MAALIPLGIVVAFVGAVVWFGRSLDNDMEGY